MKNILVATNFSLQSKHTIQYLINLMQGVQIPCRLLMLNTYMISEIETADTEDIISLHDKLKRESKAGLEEERQEALKILKTSHITIETASHIGSLKNVIRQLLKKENIDLVAMGKDGGKHVEAVAELLKEEGCSLLITHHK